MPAEKTTSTVVGAIEHGIHMEPYKLEAIIDGANELLKEHKVPIILQNFDYGNSPRFVVQQREAETMLLDWLSDAEIGEVLFNALRNIDEGTETLDTVLHGPATLATPRLVREGLGKLAESRKSLATFLRWVETAAVRRGRPPLHPDDAALIAAE